MNLRTPDNEHYFALYKSGNCFLSAVASATVLAMKASEVMAVGPGRILDSGERVVPDVKTGERVLFAKYSGTEFKLELDELLILRESDILAIVTGNGK